MSTYPLFFALMVPSTVDQTFACGGCYRLPYRTLLEKVEMSERVVVAHAVTGTRTKWKIDQVLKGNDKIGVDIEFSPSVASSLPQVLLWNVDSWRIVTAADPQLVRFLRGSLILSKSMPAAPTIRQFTQQLRYFLPYLEHEDNNIADSAHGKLVAAPYSALRDIADELDRKRILSWIDLQSSTNSERIARSIVLLGICGDIQDSHRIERWLQDSVGIDNVGYLTALLTANIELNREAAVNSIEQSFIRNPERKLAELIAAVDALRTHGQAQTSVGRDRVTSSYRLLLRYRPALAELVIDDFVRWEEWSMTPKLIEFYTSGDQPWNNALILRYMKACPLPQARKFLEQQTDIDQQMIISAK